MDFLNKLLDKIVTLLASVPVIVTFGIWTIIHTLMSFEYVAFISDVTFWTGMIILRGQNKDAEQQKKYVKQDLNESKKILNLLEK